IEDIWNKRDRDYNIRCLVKRLHRIDKQMSARAREQFAAFLPDGDVAKYARGLTVALRQDFVAAMKLLRDLSFQDLLENYERARDSFLRAIETEDVVTSEWVMRDGAGKEMKPEDYLAAFSRFVRENRDHIAAIRVLLDRPRDWSGSALTELRMKLTATSPRFAEDQLRKAHEIQYHRALVDIISMVKHAADEQAPLLTAPERVERALVKVTAGKKFSPEQQQWIDRIGDHLRVSLSIDASDFDMIPIFSDRGGLRVARRLFGGQLDALLGELNEAIAA